MSGGAVLYHEPTIITNLVDVLAWRAAFTTVGWRDRPIVALAGTRHAGRGTARTG